MNLLQNSDFRGGTYEPVGQVALVLPKGWLAGWLDNGNLYRVVSDSLAVEKYAAYNAYGPRHRPSMAKCLKPEILTIQSIPPYLDPPRTEPPDQAVTGFKLYGTLCWWLSQRVNVTSGRKYRLGARAHAWARATEDPGDARYSHGVGYGPFHMVEGSGATDDQQNYRFRVGVDLAGNLDPLASAGVQWANGAHIYNEFWDVPALEFTASGHQVTVFVMVDNLWGFINSNAYLSRPFLEEFTPPELAELTARVDALEIRVSALEAGTPLPPPGIAPVITLQPMNATSYAGAIVRFTASATGNPVPTCAWLSSRDGGNTWEAAQGLDTLLSFTVDLTDNGRMFKAVFTNAWGNVTSDVATLSVVQVIWRERLQSLAGFHIEGTGAKRDGKTGFGYGDFLREMRLAGRAVTGMKGFLTAGELMQMKTDTPGSISTWRGRVLEIDEDNPRQGEDWKWDPSQNRDIARKWMDGLLDRAKLDLSWIDIMEISNEANGALPIQFRNQNLFFLEAMQYIDSLKIPLRLGICSWSSGCPKTPLIQPGEMDQLAYFVPALEYAALHGHVLCVHDGSLNADRPLFRQAYQDKTALRYRYVKQLMDSLGKPMPNVAITEGYWPDGYRNRNPWDDMVWYLTEIGKDLYVILFAWFTLGSYSFDGKNEVNVVGQMARYLEAAKLVPPLDGHATLVNRIQRFALSVRETPKRLKVYYGKR
jgi:hypothetical protein